MKNVPRQFALVALFSLSSLVFTQPLPRLNNMTPAVTLVSPAMITPALKPCAKPAEVFDMDDYSGPLNHLVARFSQSIESNTVHIPRHHGIRPCSLNAADKFHMFVESTADPLNYVGAAWDATTAQRDHDDPTYGQGSAGF